jgi:hypothetical protein
MKRSELFVNENSSTLLTAVGVAGTVITSALSSRAGWRAANLVRTEEEQREHDREGAIPMLPKEKAKFVWPCYVPPAVTGAGTIGAIIMANRLSSKKAAALAAAYGISERAFAEYRDKVVEKIGQAKATAVRDAVAQDKVAKEPPAPQSEVVIAGTGDVLCCDLMTMRYFISSMEKIRKAENNINFKIAQEMYASLTDFYDELGLQPTMFSDDVGFNLDYRCDVRVSTAVTPDDRPCLAIGFDQGPIQGYARIHS